MPDSIRGPLPGQTFCDTMEAGMLGIVAGLCVNSGWVFLKPLSTCHRSLASAWHIRRGDSMRTGRFLLGTEGCDCLSILAPGQSQRVGRDSAHQYNIY